MNDIRNILNGQGGDDSDWLDRLDEEFQRTEAASDGGVVLPAGTYVMRAVGRLKQSRIKQTNFFELELTVADGGRAGRKIWHAIWLTPDALPLARRDLDKLGIKSLKELRGTLPSWLLEASVRVRVDDNGEQRNHIRRFKLLEVLPADPATGRIEGVDL